MDCNIIKKLLSAYADKSLDAQESLLVKNHIEHCNDCSAEFKSIEKYHQSFSGLSKVKAPANFVEQLNKRLKPQSFWQTLLLPLKSGPSFKFAGAALTLLLMFLLYQGIKPGLDMPATDFMTKKEPGTEMEIAVVPKVTAKAKLRSRVVLKAKPAEKPIELALVFGAGMEDMTMDAEPAAGTSGGGAKEIESSAMKRSLGVMASEVTLPSTNLIKLQNLISEVKAKAVSQDKDSITIDIPANNYPLFVRKLTALGNLQKPAPLNASVGKRFVRVRIKILKY